MPPATDQAWLPNLSPKQVDVFNDHHRFLLVSGPRISGKTHGILHKLARHMWDVPNANVGMFAKTIKSAKESGSWSKLHRIVLPEWCQANIGFEYLTKDPFGNPGPKVDNVTRTPFFAIKNRWYDQFGPHGGISECRLYSCDCDEEVEAKTKGMEFSLVYFSELSNFLSEIVFSGTIPLLRMGPPITYEMHQWMADTNPAEEGEDSWIYQKFYLHMLGEGLEKQADKYGLIEIMMKDNPFITEDQINDIKSACHYDSSLFDRYCNGLWTKGGLQERHFAKVFSENTHVVGERKGVDEEDWEVLLPSNQCDELITCWDLGERNHAAQIMERVRDQNGNLLYFAVLDELVYINDDVGTEEFAAQMLDKMRYWERTMGHKVNWLHFSDDSAIKQWKASIKGVDASLVRQATHDEVILIGCPKEPDSVRARVQLLKRLLFQNRIFFSVKCPATIDAIKELRVSKKDFIQKMNNKHKHPFDSLTYGLTMCTLDDLDYTRSPSTGKTGLIMAR